MGSFIQRFNKRLPIGVFVVFIKLYRDGVESFNRVFVSSRLPLVLSSRRNIFPGCSTIILLTWVRGAPCIFSQYSNSEPPALMAPSKSWQPKPCKLSTSKWSHRVLKQVVRLKCQAGNRLVRDSHLLSRVGMFSDNIISEAPSLDNCSYTSCRLFSCIRLNRASLISNTARP